MKLPADLGRQAAESSPDFYTVQLLWELQAILHNSRVHQGLWSLNGILLFIFLYLYLHVTLISFFHQPREYIRVAQPLCTAAEHSDDTVTQACGWGS